MPGYNVLLVVSLFHSLNIIHCLITTSSHVGNRENLPAYQKHQNMASSKFQEDRKFILGILIAAIAYAVKYTTIYPTQLPTTPIAEYELVNISGINS